MSILRRRECNLFGSADDNIMYVNVDDIYIHDLNHVHHVYDINTRDIISKACLLL